MSYKTALRAFALSSLLLTAAVAAIPDSGEDSDWGITRVKGFVDAYTGNLAFQTRDLAVSGAVGKYGLTWARAATSRDSGRASFFGLGHN